MTVDELAACVRLLWHDAKLTDRLQPTTVNIAALWTIGLTADAATLHGKLGDHDPADCPICRPDLYPATVTPDVHAVAAAAGASVGAVLPVVMANPTEGEIAAATAGASQAALDAMS